MTGRQSSDVGDLRKQNELLMRQLELVQQQHGEEKGSHGKEEAKEPSFDDRIAEISRQVEAGYEQGRSDVSKLAEGSEAARNVSPNPARTSGKQATAASPYPTRKCGRACWQNSDNKGKHWTEIGGRKSGI